MVLDVFLVLLIVVALPAARARGGLAQPETRRLETDWFFAAFLVAIAIALLTAVPSFWRAAHV